MEKKEDCLKCGECCYWKDGDKLIKCPYLQNKLCIIYHRRHGRKVGKLQNGEPMICLDLKDKACPKGKWTNLP